MYDQGESKDDRMVDLIDVWWSRELVYIYINNQVAGNSHPILGLATRFSTEITYGEVAAFRSSPLYQLA